MRLKTLVYLIAFFFVYPSLLKAEERHNSLAHKGGRFIGEIIIDALTIHRYLFTLDSMKILTALTPFYLGGRMIDEDVQCHFYDPAHHKNINQHHPICHKVAQTIIGVPMVVLSSLAIFANNENLRMTGRIFAIGLPFVHWGKNLIKNLDGKICYRPWHEDFSCKKRSLGGFPSGHMANITYMTMLFGMRFGAKFGIPLGLLGAFVFVEFVTCNRHYVSQLVAGAGLGVLYAFAANKVIEKKLCDRWKLAMGIDERGRTTLGVTCNF